MTKMMLPETTGKSHTCTGKGTIPVHMVHMCAHTFNSIKRMCIIPALLYTGLLHFMNVPVIVVHLSGHLWAMFANTVHIPVNIAHTCAHLFHMCKGTGAVPANMWPVILHMWTFPAIVRAFRADWWVIRAGTGNIPAGTPATGRQTGTVLPQTVHTSAGSVHEIKNSIHALALRH